MEVLKNQTEMLKVKNSITEMYEHLEHGECSTFFLDFFSHFYIQVHSFKVGIWLNTEGI